MKIDRKRYSSKKFGKETEEQMVMLIDTLEKNFEDIDQSWIAVLDLLAINYRLMFNAYEDIIARGNTQYDERHRLTKNPSIQIFQSSQNNIQNLLNKMGFTTLSKARAKALMREDPDLEDEFADKFMN